MTYASTCILMHVYLAVYNWYKHTTINYAKKQHILEMIRFAFLKLLII